MKLWLFVIVCYVPASFSVLPCGYTPWSCWSDCDASCGDKIQSRERSCTNPPPSLPGFDCSGLGPAIEVRQCYGPPNQIDVDGGYNNWGLWSECTKDCGGGIQYRRRWCVDPHPQGKGKECSEQKELGPPVESRSCNQHDCSEEPTEAPTTEELTEAPTTEEPTEPPTTVESTEAPTTEKASTTEELTEAPKTEESTEAPMTEEGSTTEELTEGPATEESTEAPTAEEGSTTEESTEAPTTEESTEAPMTEEGSTTEESTEAPTTEEGSTTEELTEGPTTEETTEAPTAEEGSTTEESTEAPTTEESTEAPTTEESTEAPMTEEGSTTEESTEAPTTGEGSTTEELTEGPATEEATEAPTAEEGSTTEVSTEAPTTEKGSTTEESTEAPMTEEGSTTEESTEAPTTEEGSTTEELTEAPTTKEATEAPTAEEGSTTKESTEAPTTEEGSTTEESSEAPKTEESTEAPTMEEVSTTEESSETPTTEESTEAPTTKEPAEAPTTEELTEAPRTEVPMTEPPCTRALDLGIIIDKSKSVKIANLRKLKRSLEKFVHKFEVSAEGTHVGLISFNDNAELLFDFKDDRYHTEDQLRKAIKKIPLKLEYQTRTDLALTLAKEKLFSDKGGDRPNVPNALIIFTDGKSTGKRKHKGFVPIPETVKILTEVKKVHIHAVGIGRSIRESELAKLAGDTGDYCHVTNFKKLNTILEKLRDAACADADSSVDEREYINGISRYLPSSFSRRYNNVRGGLLDARHMR